MITMTEQLIPGYRYNVMSPGMWENEQGPADWFAVVDEESGGIVVYAMEERVAIDIANAMQRQLWSNGRSMLTF
jgi:hypothetical protein